MKQESFNADIIKINILGIQEKVNLKDDLITKNVTPIELNKKLSVLPNLYSRWGHIRIELDNMLEKKQAIFDNWLSDKIEKITGDEPKKYTSETARERAVMIHKIYGKEYKKYKDDLRELKYNKNLADIARKGYDRQYFTIKEQVSLINKKRAEATIPNKKEL